MKLKPFGKILLTWPQTWSTAVLHSVVVHDVFNNPRSIFQTFQVFAALFRTKYLYILLKWFCLFHLSCYLPSVHIFLYSVSVAYFNGISRVRIFKAFAIHKCFRKRDQLSRSQNTNANFIIQPVYQTLNKNFPFRLFFCWHWESVLQFHFLLLLFVLYFLLLHSFYFALLFHVPRKLEKQTYLTCLILYF